MRVMVIEELVTTVWVEVVMPWKEGKKEKMKIESTKKQMMNILLMMVV